LTQPSGHILDGDWINGKFNGHGSYQNESGDFYVGDFVNGKCHGKCVLTQPGGHKLDGDWIDGEFTGHGSYKYHNGDVYVGDIVANKRHGKGVYVKKYDGKYITEDGYWFNNDFLGQDDSILRILEVSTVAPSAPRQEDVSKEGEN